MLVLALQFSRSHLTSGAGDDLEKSRRHGQLDAGV
jgi:hypothetical protein